MERMEMKDEVASERPRVAARFLAHSPRGGASSVRVPGASYLPSDPPFCPEQPSAGHDSCPTSHHSPEAHGAWKLLPSSVTGKSDHTATR